MKNRSKSAYRNNNGQPNTELVDALAQSLSVLIQMGIDKVSRKLSQKNESRR